MNVRGVCYALVTCFATLVSGAVTARADGPCRLVVLNSMLKPGHAIRVGNVPGLDSELTYIRTNLADCLVLVSAPGMSDDSVKSLSVDEVTRVSYKKRGELSSLTMAVAAVGGAALGAAIGSFVDPAEVLPSDYVGEDEQKGPIAGAIAGGVVGLAAGTIIPLVLKRTYVIEF